MKILFADKETTYDGSQLRSHWIYDTFGILGNALVAFVGPCDVRVQKMVDLVDVKENKPIFSHKMLHFIGEIFDLDLEKMIWKQRLLIGIILEQLIHETKQATLTRAGNDLYDNKAKLSVAIATLSPVSSVLHVGVNIESRDTPVLTKGLADYKVPAKAFAEKILQRFQNEVQEVVLARAKVRGVD